MSKDPILHARQLGDLIAAGLVLAERLEAVTPAQDGDTLVDIDTYHRAAAEILEP